MMMCSESNKQDRATNKHTLSDKQDTATNKHTYSDKQDIVTNKRRHNKRQYIHAAYIVETSSVHNGVISKL